jgi:uncharacterized protein
MPVLIGGDFIREVVETFLSDRRFQIHFHALGRWGGPNDRTIATFSSAAEEHAALANLVQASRAAGCLSEQLVQWDEDEAVGESGHAICYASRANAWVIRADGRVAKCTIAFKDDRNTVGKLL